MLKKKLLILPLMGTLLFACSDPAQEQSPAEMEEEATEAVEGVEGGEVEEIAVNISFYEDGEELSDLTQTLEVTDGTILIEAMEEQYEVEGTDGFLTSIEGHEQDEANSKYWMYTVNGEEAPVGAHEYELQADDQIEWRLESID